MKAIPDKFQAFAEGESTFDKTSIFRTFGKTQIECETTVKLLGIEIDYLLKYDVQVS